MDFRLHFNMEVNLAVRFTLVCLLIFSQIRVNSQECYPSDSETLLLEYVNLIRANPNKETLIQDLKLNEYSEQKKIPPYNHEIFQKELENIKPLAPVFYEPFLSLASRNHSNYMIANGQSHEEFEGKPFFSGKRFVDRIQSVNRLQSGISENCYLKSFGVRHCMLAFLIDWGEGHGGMQLGRPHRQNIFNSKAALMGNGCIPHSEGFLAVTQIFASGDSNCVYYGGVIYTDYNNNDFYDPGEGHGNFKIIGNEGELNAVSYPSGLYVIKANIGLLKTIRFEYLDFTKTIVVNQQSGNQKIDLKLTINQENQIFKSLQNKWQNKIITDSDLAWLCLNFKFQNINLIPQNILLEMADLKAFKASILNELSIDSIENLNQMIGQLYKNYKSESLHDWLKSLSYLTNMRAQFSALKNNENTNIAALEEFKGKINTTKYYNSNEANFYLRKLIHNVDVEIQILKEKK